MKKVSIIVLVAGIALLAGCAKESAQNVPAEPGTVTFSFIFPGSGTKTAVDSENNDIVTWTAGDKIGIYDRGYYYATPAEYTLSDGAGTTCGIFSGSAINEPTLALYPFVPIVQYDDAESCVIPVIPSEQTAVAGSFDPSAAIMYGPADQSPCALNYATSFLKIKIPSDAAGVAAIIIESDDAFLTGPIGVHRYGSKLVDFTDGAKNYVTLKPEKGILTAGGTYYIAVRPFSSGDLTITFIYLTESHKAVTKSKRSTAMLDAVEGHVKEISVDFSTGDVITHTATQLWEDGPYFADFNAGSKISDYGVLDDTVETYNGWMSGYNTANVGGLYPWRNPTKNGRADVWGEDLDVDIEDISTALWGRAWRDPDPTDISDLRDGLTAPGTGTTGMVWSWCDGSAVKYCTGCTLAGFKVTGEAGTDWETNSIFLPAAGYFDIVAGVNEVSFQGLGFFTAASYGTTPVEFGFLNEVFYDDEIDYPFTGFSYRPILNL